MKEYFYKKEYGLMYAKQYFLTLGNSIIDIFGAVMLYKNGLSISWIFLIFGLRFGIMGLITPFFIKIASKKGIAFCGLLANIFRLVATGMILTNQYNILGLAIILSLPGALSNPIGNAMASKYVENHHRGRYNSIIIISRVLGQATGSVMVTLGVIKGDFTVVLLITAIVLIIDYLIAKCLDYKPEQKQKRIFKKAFHYMVHQKSDLKEFLCFEPLKLLKGVYCHFIYILLLRIL